MEEHQIRPGDVVASKYRVEKVLGAGGMGVVVAARHVTLGHLVAIKVMQPRAVAVKGAVERFEREAQAAASLQSKHVMKVHDHGKLESGAPYMVMEHLTGADLASVLEKRGPVPVPDAAEYLLQACEAIAEAHAKGIVHRDLKPANLFLQTEPDGAPLIKVLDFGIAKVAGAEQGLTGTSQGMGSGGYMSPEQMASAKKVDHRADVWALGVTLYELITACRPFEADSLEQFVARVFHGQPTPLSAHRPDLPRELEAVILRCLEKAPDDRFSSVAHFAHQIAPYAPPRAHGYVARIARQLGVEAPALAQTGPGVAPPAPPAAPLPAAAGASGPYPAAAASGPYPAAASGPYPAAGASGPYPAAASGPYPAAGASGPYPAAASGAYSAASSGPYPAIGPTGPAGIVTGPAGPQAAVPGAAGGAAAGGPHAPADGRVSTVPATAPLVAPLPGSGAAAGRPAAPPSQPRVVAMALGALLLIGLGGGGVWLAMRPSATADPSGGGAPSSPPPASAPPSQAAAEPPAAVPPPTDEPAAPAPTETASAAAAQTTSPAAGKPTASAARPGAGAPTSSAKSTWTPLATDPKGVNAPPRAPGGPRN